MNKVISQFISEQFYQGLLISGEFEGKSVGDSVPVGKWVPASCGWPSDSHEGGSYQGMGLFDREWSAGWIYHL